MTDTTALEERLEQCRADMRFFDAAISIAEEGSAYERAAEIAYYQKEEEADALAEEIAELREEAAGQCLRAMGERKNLSEY